MKRGQSQPAGEPATAVRNLAVGTTRRPSLCSGGGDAVVTHTGGGALGAIPEAATSPRAVHRTQSLARSIKYTFLKSKKYKAPHVSNMTHTHTRARETRGAGGPEGAAGLREALTPPMAEVWTSGPQAALQERVPPLCCLRSAAVTPDLFAGLAGPGRSRAGRGPALEPTASLSVCWAGAPSPRVAPRLRAGRLSG